MYKGDAGYMTTGEQATLETFLKRGGGLVGIHDAICADDPEWWSTIFGGAKKHGEVNYTLEAAGRLHLPGPRTRSRRG